MGIFRNIREFRNNRVNPTIINQEQIDYLITYLLETIETKIDGDVVEFGCYVGESSKYLMKTILETQSNKKLYVYDSFEGLPSQSEWEQNTGWSPGSFSTSQEVLIKNFSDNQLPLPIIHKDWFKNIPNDKIPDKISFAFLDGDFYESIYDSLNKVYDKVSDGGYICFHDYLRNNLPGVKAAIEQFFKERNLNYYIMSICDQLGIIQKNRVVQKLKIPNDTPKKLNIQNKELTVVTGLWNIDRPGRDFNHYIEHFKNFLDIPVQMFIYIPPEYEYLVWEKRNREDTFVKTADLEYIKTLYSPFWDKTQEIRVKPEWYNLSGENGWLKNSPQAILQWYNPIVQSKMFLLNDATIWNPFNTEYFIWLDAGITNTVYDKMLTENRALDKITPQLNSFLFLSYPYESSGEIHGFEFKAINRFAKDTVKYVCRGGLFGGKKDVINQANATYYSTLSQTLNSGYMGTEECIFSIMSYREPHIYRRYALDDNGLIVKFIQALIEDKCVLEPIPELKEGAQISISNYDLSKVKTNLYILTFNFPEQLQYTIDSMEKVPEWLEKPHLVLIDNSTDEEAIAGNKIIAEKYGFEYIKMDHNTGICGGRQKAAEHFHNSDADFMFFFEDDMTVNSSELEGQFCRNGFRKYIPNLYSIVHKIMLKEKFDFLKLSFTEVFFDNDKALPWYNTPQNIRTRDWPEYDQLPITGLDPNSPPTKFKNIKIYDGVSYITGEINYCNWPMIVSKEGNKKMFINTTWAHAYEQTWSSHIYQLTKEGKINSGLLLASPIWHERIKWYKPEERREN
jgi:O-methyltransferase